jgi:hypothetical protein
VAAEIPDPGEGRLHVQAQREDQVSGTQTVGLTRIFYKFDEDGSQTLEVEEFLSMFRENYLESFLESIDPLCQE